MLEQVLLLRAARGLGRRGGAAAAVSTQPQARSNFPGGGAQGLGADPAADPRQRASSRFS